VCCSAAVIFLHQAAAAAVIASQAEQSLGNSLYDGVDLGDAVCFTTLGPASHFLATKFFTGVRQVLPSVKLMLQSCGGRNKLAYA
jgi:hypothetical protein